MARAISNNGVVMRDLGGGSPQHPLLFEEATAINFWGDVAGIESAAGILAFTAVRYSDQVATPNGAIPHAAGTGRSRPAVEGRGRLFMTALG